MLLHQRFVNIAKRHGRKLAIVDRSTDKRIDYSTALIGSLILARKFKKYDKGFIGIMVPTSAGAALSILGAMMSGRIPVIINYSTGAKENAEYAQSKCNFETIITSKALLEKIDCPKIPGMVFLEDILKDVTKAVKVQAALKSKMPVPALLRTIHRGKEDDTSVILFTSGSEKSPKAVELSHRNIITNIQGYSGGFGLSGEHRMLSVLPFFHVFGLTTNLWTPLYHGMTMIAYASPIEYRTVCKIVREEQPTMMVGTPSFFWGYLHKSDPGDFNSIRIAVVGADKCPATLRRAFEKKHGVELLEGYGATETAPVISSNLPTANKPGSVGKPLPNVQVRIENFSSGEKCQPGEVGKIKVKGDLVMKGYFDDLEETSLRIRKGWYDTGDMGYLDEDGFLWHAGRLKRFVKVGGEMVSLVQVEEVLSELLPEDVQCCVIEIPDAIKGAQIAAAVTQAVDKSEILKKMSRKLPNIALPKRFFRFEDLPKMGSGKIDFRKTTEMVRHRIEMDRRDLAGAES